MTAMKICGITTVEDARRCVALGVEAIGLNWIQRSPRLVSLATTQQIVQAVGHDILTVAVVADVAAPDLHAWLEATGVKCLQLHGHETPAELTPLLPHAYKAVAIADSNDVQRARSYPGSYLLVDAKDEQGRSGGTGSMFPWHLVTDLARERKLALAGGLTADNVAEAIARVHPYAVDVASGVEAPGQPRQKDPARLERFVQAVRLAG